jgi:hypothetical protein
MRTSPRALVSAQHDEEFWNYKNFVILSSRRRRRVEGRARLAAANFSQAA